MQPYFVLSTRYIVLEVARRPQRAALALPLAAASLLPHAATRAVHVLPHCWVRLLCNARVALQTLQACAVEHRRLRRWICLDLGSQIDPIMHCSLVSRADSAW